MRLRAVLTVPVTAIAVGALMLVTGAFGQGSSVGSLALQPGVNMGVSCPNPLSNANVQPNSLTVQCAGSPNTSNSSTTSSSTTTMPAITTTVPPTTQGTTPVTAPVLPPPGGCRLSQPAFCDTFDNPTVNGPANSRTGQLNGAVWGTSMVTGSNPGGGIATVPSACGSGNLNYPANIEVCSGQLVDTVTDGGTVSSLAMYPRQPFDFAGRTGTIAFDVSNDSQGSHAAWPELWMTDQPVPDPFTHEATWQSQPRNGLGIRFAGCTTSTGLPESCNSPAQVGVDSALVVNNYVVNDSFNGGNLQVLGDQAVNESGPGQMNHYQVQVSQNRIDVYGTDAFTGTWNAATNPLRHISTISGFTLGFTRGLVWLEDVHYNANKFATQGTHTFRWDNFGFDGPVLPRDLSFDAPNNHVADSSIAGGSASGFDNAYDVPTNGSLNLTVPSVNNVAGASGALIEFNFYSEAVIPLHVALNGHDLSIPWPYPDTTTSSPRTIAIPVPLADITAGNNTVTFSAGNYLFEVMNIDLILQGAGGIVAP